MLIGRREETISKKEFTKYFGDLRQLDPNDLRRGDGPDGPRSMAFRASQSDDHGDPVLHSDAGWERLFELFADKFGNGGDEIRVRNDDGSLTSAGRRLMRIDHAADVGDEFWERSDVLRVRVKGLPQNVDGGKLRSGGIEVPRAQVSMWFGGPNTETMGNVVLKGAEWAVEADGAKVRISGNNSLWDDCPTWRVETEDANILPNVTGDEDLKLAQNNRDPLCGVRRMLSRELYALAGVAIGRARPAEVSLAFGNNLSFQGQRTLIEPAESVLRRFFPHERKGNLYELNWTGNGPANLATQRGRSTQEFLKGAGDIYDLKGKNDRNDETNDRSDLALLMDRLNSDHRRPDYAKKLEEVLDVKSWMRALAVSVATGNWDGFVDTASNGYMYNGGHPDEAAGDDKHHFMKKPYFTFIPNDTDNSLGSAPIRDGQERNFAYADMFKPQNHIPGGPYMPMIDKLMKVPEFRDYYVEFMSRFLDQVFKPDVVEDLMGTANGGNGNEGFWPQIRDVSMREGFFGDAPRTKRWHSNDAIHKFGIGHEQLNEGWRNLYGVKHHVNMAHDHLSGMCRRYQPSDPGRRYSSEDMPIGKPVPVKVG